MLEIPDRFVLVWWVIEKWARITSGPQEWVTTLESGEGHTSQDSEHLEAGGRVGKSAICPTSGKK